MKYTIRIEPFETTTGAPWRRRPRRMWRARVSCVNPDGPSPLLPSAPFVADSRDGARVRAERWVDEVERRRLVREDGAQTYNYTPNVNMSSRLGCGWAGCGPGGTNHGMADVELD